MDIAHFERSVLAAEAVKCAHGQYAGIPLGTLMRAWPDEVVSGRVGAGRGRGPTTKIIKQYVKLIQMIAEFNSLIEQHKEVLSVDAAGRFSGIPAVATVIASDALVPIASENSPVEFPEGAVISAAGPPKAGRALDLGRMAQEVVYNPAVHSPKSWRRFAGAGLALLVTLVAPRLVCKACALLFEGLMRFIIHLSGRVFVTAAFEFEDAGTRVLDVFASAMGISLSSFASVQPSTALPAAQRAVSIAHAVTAAADAVSQDMDGNATALDVAVAVKQTVAHVLAAHDLADHNPAAAVAHSWHMPGWAAALLAILAWRIPTAHLGD